MTLSPDSKVGALIDAHPGLVDFLAEKHPEFAKLKNPILRNTVARVATLSMASALANMPVETLIQEIDGFINKAPAEPQTRAERLKIMKEIVLELHGGGDFALLKKRFESMARGLEHSEVAEMEQTLLKEGMPVAEIQKMCDVHAAMFQGSLKEQEAPKVPKGHPLYWYMEENRAMEELLLRAEKLLAGDPLGEASRKLFADLLREIGGFQLHFTRKENQLFPLLEKHGVDAPSKVMWAVDDEIRAAYKSLLQDMDELPAGALRERTAALFLKLRDMVTKEEHILFPLSVDTIPGPEWQPMKQGDREIGFAWIRPETGASGAASPAASAGGLLKLATGELSPDTVDLILNHLPLDISFVDADDKVRYYNQGLGERIFPRSPAVIGREVRNCHPPKSLALVEKILAEFKSGAKDAAEFWTNSRGRFLHIRYFAVRDAGRKYRGALEVSQDVTAIRALSGERRILDWR